MTLSKHYNPQETEPRLQEAWQEAGVYRFSMDSDAPVYSIDTPPATVSGNLHLGHAYSYTHPDLIARFWRMRGFNVFYPMGYDDNGLPTERLVEKRLGVTAAQAGRSAFIEKCLQVSEAAEAEYQALWQRLGLSIDWRYTYRTIDERARRISQLSFIDLYRKGLVYQREAPTIWCPECQTAIAQAEVNDLERESEFVVLEFPLTPSPSPAGRGGQEKTDLTPDPSPDRRGGQEETDLTPDPSPPRRGEKEEEMNGGHLPPLLGGEGGRGGEVPSPSPSPSRRGEQEGQMDRGHLPPLLSGEGGRGGEVPSHLPIATTRPELLPACVAVFVHPEDARYRDLIGRRVRVPLFGQTVPVLADPGADPEKGTGAVMCCTFGDSADVAWWYAHRLPLVQAIDRQGRMTQAAGALAGLPLEEARRQVKLDLEREGSLLKRLPVSQSVRVHERCDTPVEYIVTRQWFVRVLDFKEQLLTAGEQVTWRPQQMGARYRAWVENLSWDWCISRQRVYGVPFPLWYCKACGEVVLAEADQLPVDPLNDAPAQPCACGSREFTPEQDVFDTWATSSLSPQIAGGWPGGQAEPADGGEEPAGRLYERVFPFSLRPQAHEIIRTWAFYTIIKSMHHFEELPWKEALISGWGIAGEGMGKISKSRGGGPMPPLEMIERYSADAVRYWASSAGPGKDSVISEEKIQTGARLVTKLWNVARFSARFIEGYRPPSVEGMRGEGEKGKREAGEKLHNPSPGPLSPTPLLPIPLSPADRWILSRLQKLIRRVTGLMEAAEYAAARSEVESFFWNELADNYLEMCKQRLYEEGHPQREGARFALYHLLLALVKLFAPFLPYVTEEIYQGLFAGEKAAAERQAAGEAVGMDSIHRSAWPIADPNLEDEAAEAAGVTLVSIATAVRRFKSERSLSLGMELDRLQLAAGDVDLAQTLQEAGADLKSVTRARQIEIVRALDPALEEIRMEGGPLRAAVGGKRD